MEELARRATLDDADKIRWALRYAPTESESWKQVEGYVNPPADGLTFAEFKRQVRATYPQLNDDRRYTIHDLNSLIRRTQEYQDMSRTDLGTYSRRFNTFTGYLIRMDRLSPREQSGSRTETGQLQHSTFNIQRTTGVDDTILVTQYSPLAYCRLLPAQPATACRSRSNRTCLFGQPDAESIALPGNPDRASLMENRPALLVGIPFRRDKQVQTMVQEQARVAHHHTIVTSTIPPSSP